MFTSDETERMGLDFRDFVYDFYRDVQGVINLSFSVMIVRRPDWLYGRVMVWGIEPHHNSPIHSYHPHLITLDKYAGYDDDVLTSGLQALLNDVMNHYDLWAVR